MPDDPSRIVSVVGFDSAWTDNPKKPGAVCVIRIENDGCRLVHEPELSSFAQAEAIIRNEQKASSKCVVALDQPTIVPNLTGSRPVDKVAGSLISWAGGGVQPASRAKKGMFNDAAPIWRFKSVLGASDEPEEARVAEGGLFLVEVFPALALVLLEPSFHQRLAAPKYNPTSRKKFRPADWRKVAHCAEVMAEQYGLTEAAEWCLRSAAMASPRKADQDRLDAMLCALIGLHWLLEPRERSLMIGDLETGYMIAPAPYGVSERLVSAALARDVSIRSS
ncbi:DUF429 domain-containing protein [uncultured Martelella sp.]|uniref:DUF429 domain-containing protein n=1 Tax=uncultured Martelella sp. TaxID=392331 RepID=UPI0029C64CC3|nr:DUF429 domain-containing protein [uncultured Martelella sp.]